MISNNYINQIKLKRFCMLPNDIFSIGLRAGEISLYAYLLKCENRKTFQCYPSYKTIGNALNISTNTVRKYVMILEEKGLIETQPTTVITKDSIKRNGSLLYTIKPIQDAVNKFNAEQIQKSEIENALRISENNKNNPKKCN